VHLRGHQLPRVAHRSAPRVEETAGGRSVSAIDNDDLLAVLEERPYLEEELVALAGVPADVIRFALKQLHHAHKVKRVGAERRWALAAYQAPMERPHLTKPARMLREVEDVDEDLDDAIEDDAGDPDAAVVDDDELLDVPPVESRKPNRDKLLGAGGRRMYPAGTRQTAAAKKKPALPTRPPGGSSTRRPTNAIPSRMPRPRGMRKCARRRPAGAARRLSTRSEKHDDVARRSRNGAQRRGALRKTVPRVSATSVAVGRLRCDVCRPAARCAGRHGVSRTAGVDS
jgi:hypothetical protein